MAKAVVSTAIGAEGLPVKNDEHLLLRMTLPALQKALSSCSVMLGNGHKSERQRVNWLRRIIVGPQFRRALPRHSKAL